MATKVPGIEIKSEETLKREEYVPHLEINGYGGIKARFANNIFPVEAVSQKLQLNCMCRVQFANSILDLTSWTRDIRAFLKTSPPSDETKSN